MKVLERVVMAAVVASPLVATAAPQGDQKRPNVVYVLTDQWRGSALGYAGDPNIKTPNLDEFSTRSVNFTNAVSVCPVSTPHRASLLTGRYPTSTGMFLNDIYLPSEELCMGEIFKEAGYSTAYLGKWHLDGHGRTNNVDPDRRQGFDYWKALECSHNYTKMPYYDNDDPQKKTWKGYSPAAISADANQYISDHAEDENPFLIVVSIATPHFPHGSAPKKYKDMYPQEDLILQPNVTSQMEKKTRQELQGYYGHCTATDAAIGTILDKLEELDLMDNTIVVFTSDHGEMMGSHGVRPFTKQMAWDESMRVPFLISYPEIGDNQGKVVKAPINTPDILPSLLGLADVKVPAAIEGDDLSKLIRKPNEKRDRVALVMNPAPFTGNFKYPEFRAVRSSRYTYELTREGATKLFDNEVDPYQMNNLVNKPEYAKIQKWLDKQLWKKLADIGDEFHDREYYMQKWGFNIDNKRHAVDYWSFDNGGEGVVQSPQKE